MDLSDVTVVITSHDAGDVLEKTVADVHAQGTFGAIYVVDSGSQDGSIERTQRSHPDITVIRLGENRGPCATRNRGTDAAQTPLVLLLDDDMRLEVGCVQRLKEELLRQPLRAATGPRIMHADKSDSVQYEGGFWHFAGLPHMRGQDGRTLSDEPCSVDVLTSGVLLVRKDAFMDAGGFEEALFYLMEDAEFSMRLRFLGWSLWTVPGARASNAGGSSGLSLSERAYPARRVRLHARNRCLVVLCLYDLPTLLILWPGLLLMDLAWFVFAILRGHGGEFLRGKLDLIHSLGAVRGRRRTLINRKQVSDRVLMNAPAVTLTEAAGSQPAVRVLTRVLDAMLRLILGVSRWMLP